MSRGINANVVHHWRQLAREAAKATPAMQREFVALTIAPQLLMQAQVCCDIEVELRRGAVTMKVTWPMSAVADFAALSRELLRRYGVVVLFVQIGALSPEAQHPCGFPRVATPAS